MQANQALLVGLAALDAGGGELAHEFDATRQSDRIEAKLNLTLHLLARFMAAQCPQPAAQPVTLYTDRLVWQGQPPQSIDDEQLLMLYLSAQIPEPLRLPVRIAACNPANDNTWRIDAEFQHLSDPVADWLARTIFRYHRRQIQAHRKSTQPGTAL
nr:PilZ domain-containing protein [Chitinivorax tropicus]